MKNVRVKKENEENFKRIKDNNEDNKDDTENEKDEKNEEITFNEICVLSHAKLSRLKSLFTF